MLTDTLGKRGGAEQELREAEAMVEAVDAYEKSQARS
jgi:hypothetical protein